MKSKGSEPLTGLWAHQPAAPVLGRAPPTASGSENEWGLHLKREHCKEPGIFLKGLHKDSHSQALPLGS